MMTEQGPIWGDVCLVGENEDCRARSFDSLLSVDCMYMVRALDAASRKQTNMKEKSEDACVCLRTKM